MLFGKRAALAVAGAAALLFVGAIPIQNSVVSVANNTVLSETPIAAAYSGVIVRVTDGLAGAPPEAFLAGEGTCAKAGLVSDGASCQNSNDGNHWTGIFPNGADPREWGVVADNSTDNSTTFQNALNWVVAHNSKLLLPAGRIYFATGQSVTMPTGASFTIQGQGPDGSAIRSASGQTLLTITKASGDLAGSVHLRDFSCLAASAGSGTCIDLVAQGNIAAPGYAASSDIQNVTFRGQDGYTQTDYWTTGVETNYWSNIQFYNDSFIGPSGTAAGIGIDLNGGSNADTIGTIFNIQSSNFGMLNEGIMYGPYIQGVTIGQSNFTGVNYGVYVPAGEAQVAQLTVGDSQFATNDAAVYDASGVDALNFHNNFVINLGSGTIGLDLVVYSNAIVSGNTFTPGTGATSEAVNFGSPVSGQGAFADGNLWVGLATGAKLEPSALNVTIGKGNVSLSTTTPVVMNNATPYVDRDIVSWAPYATYSVSAAQSGRGGAIELTTATLNTASTVSGQHWLCNLANTGRTSTTVGIFPIQVIDNTHVLLNASSYRNTLTGVCFASGL